jgi:hypothetical protein
VLRCRATAGIWDVIGGMGCEKRGLAAADSPRSPSAQRDAATGRPLERIQFVRDGFSSL